MGKQSKRKEDSMNDLWVTLKQIEDAKDLATLTICNKCIKKDVTKCILREEDQCEKHTNATEIFFITKSVETSIMN